MSIWNRIRKSLGLAAPAAQSASADADPLAGIGQDTNLTERYSNIRESSEITRLCRHFGMAAEAEIYSRAADEEGPGDAKTQLPILQSLLMRCEEAFGADHLYTGAVLEHLGVSSTRPEAEALWTRCVALRERQLGVAHPATIRMRYMWGMNCHWLQKPALGIERLEPILRMVEKDPALTFPWFPQMLSLLGIFYRTEGAMESAEACWRRLLDITELKHGPRHPESSMGRVQLGQFLIRAGKNSEAAAVLRRALADLKDPGPGTDERVVGSALAASTCMAELEDFVSAEAFYQIALMFCIRRGSLPNFGRPFRRPRLQSPPAAGTPST